MIPKKYIFIFSIVIIVAGLFYIAFWYIQAQEHKNIFDRIASQNFKAAEKQVGEKIIRLLDDTKENPESAYTWGKLGMNLYIHDYKEVSIDCFQQAHQLDESDFRWLYFCAVALDEINSNDAIHWYEQSRIIDSDYPPLNVKLGNRYILTGQSELARQVFNSIIDAGLTIPHAHLGLAKIEIENGQLTQAKKHLNNALEQAPEFREAHALMAQIYRQEGKGSKVKQTLDIMKDLPERMDLADPIYYQMVNEGVSSFWCQVRGNNLLKAGKISAAEKEFKKALAAKPNQASFTSLGYVYQLQKKYDEAIQQYESALKIDPNYVDAINNLGVIYFEKGDVEGGISMVEKALQIQPETIDSYLNLGTFHKHKRSYEKSVYYYQEGMKREPNDYRFAYQLAWLYSSCPLSSIRNGKEAIRLAELVCEYHKYKNAASLDLLAAAYAENREYQRAAETAQKASQLARANKQHRLLDDINERIELYKKRQAYRED
jgi:superkiller protein 3